MLVGQYATETGHLGPARGEALPGGRGPAAAAPHPQGPPADRAQAIQGAFYRPGDGKAPCQRR